jgi:hypothetical protein
MATISLSKGLPLSLPGLSVAYLIPFLVLKISGAAIAGGDVPNPTPAATKAFDKKARRDGTESCIDNANAAVLLIAITTTTKKAVPRERMLQQVSMNSSHEVQNVSNGGGRGRWNQKPIVWEKVTSGTTSLRQLRKRSCVVCHGEGVSKDLVCTGTWWLPQNNESGSRVIKIARVGARKYCSSLNKCGMGQGWSSTSMHA